MTSVFDQLSLPSALAGAKRELAQKLEAILREICDEYCPGWTYDTIDERVTLVRTGDGTETLFIDASPVLRIHPMKTTSSRNGEGWRIVYSQSLERLSHRPAARSTSLQ